MRIFLPIFLIALSLSACGAPKEKKPRPSALVEAAPILHETFTDNLDAVGTAFANEQVVLSAPVTERITSLHFSDGGYVSNGQVIATLAVGQEKAELAAAQAQALAAQQQLERIQALKARGVSFHDYDLPGFKTVNHVAVLGKEKAAWFSDPEGNILCLHEDIA